MRGKGIMGRWRSATLGRRAEVELCAGISGGHDARCSCRDGERWINDTEEVVLFSYHRGDTWGVSSSPRCSDYTGSIARHPAAFLFQFLLAGSESLQWTDQRSERVRRAV